MRPAEAHCRDQTVFQVILARHSVRSYAPRPVTESEIQTLLEAAVRAPTALHQEPWAFVVIQDPVWLKRISDVARPLFLHNLLHKTGSGNARTVKTFADPHFNVFHDAGTLIVICASPELPFSQADCWLAAENLMLAACSLGLGSCVIGSAQEALNTPAVKAELGIPPEYSAVAPIVVGHPSEEAVATGRKTPQVLAWKRA
ncbi:MAG: nitroreductase family protein [Betaproteobacteria bacterium]|nr:nitroreductase family protein [Betaproteobacteria bacterium]MDE2624892.1 nitroreductase family protein [Betaproteobacteria bacterium]